MTQNTALLLTTLFATQKPYNSTDIRWETPFAIRDVYRQKTENGRFELEHRHGESPFVKRENNIPLETCTLLLFSAQDTLKEWYVDDECDGGVERVTLNPHYDLSPRKRTTIPEEGQRIIDSKYAKALEVFFGK